MKDFLTFRKMITPIIIQILFWLGILGCIVAGIVTMFSGGIALIKGGGIFAGVPILMGLVWIFIGPIFVRVYCELLILFFRINDNLVEIKRNTQAKPQ